MTSVELSSYPALAQCWQDNLGDIDEMLVDFYSGQTEQSAQALSEITGRITHWLENQKLDPETRSELNGDTDGLLQNLVQGRIAELLQNGKLQFARTMSQGASV